MKKIILSAIVLVLGLALSSQNHSLRPGLSYEVGKAKHLSSGQEASATNSSGITTPNILKNSYIPDIVNIGTSANVFSYGWGGGQRSLLCSNQNLGIVSNLHRMGGLLDPGGYSGDLGYDISTNQGLTWTLMNEFYTGFDPYFPARYPQHGIYNPPGNTDPDQAYIAFFAPGLDGSNDPGGWGGYIYGRTLIGDLTNTTVHQTSSNPPTGLCQYIPDGFTVTPSGDFWAVDYNNNLMINNTWLQQLIISNGHWNAAQEDYWLSQEIWPCSTYQANLPACARVEFSPDGQYGYIVVLTDNGNVGISTGKSLYPIFWRSSNYGQSWEGPIEVPLAGEDGIYGVKNFLDIEELEELFDPVPAPDEILFTTAYDFDLTVDSEGNPNIAVVVGITAEVPYSIITERSSESGYLFMAPFILSSTEKGIAGSWQGYALGRLQSFRGFYDGTNEDIYEDNRIQIARDHEGKKLFIAWLDTDTMVSSANDNPDIWARGYCTESHRLTYNIGTLLDEPQNMTFLSEATFDAQLFALANEVIFDDQQSYPTYILPMVYQSFEYHDPNAEVQYKYIQNAFFYKQQFLLGPPPPGIGENENLLADVSAIVPNPARVAATFSVTMREPAVANISITHVTGQMVQQHSLRLVGGSNTVNLDVQDLKSGLYLCSVEVGGKTFTRKLMVH
ncbi:MAG: T9SS type A sorting domain-containing protein [Clostridia bacterium]|nr:T9SS type A sorting domain-containing protein [Clostridia bacterium]